MALAPKPHSPCHVPADFDDDAFHAIQVSLSAYTNAPPWASYASALNAVAFRLAAADESHERFVAAVSDPMAFHPAGPRYRQEEALFAFYFNACSSVECLYFAFYNIGACVRPQSFPAMSAEQLRAVNPKRVAERFTAAFPTAPFADLLSAITKSNEFIALTDHRNFLTHRGAPARQHHFGVVPHGSVIDIGSPRLVTIASNPQAPPSDWLRDLSLTADTTAAPRLWVGRMVSQMMRAAGLWLSRLPP